MGVHWKIRLLEGVHKKTNIDGGDCLKKGAWTVSQFKGGLARRRGWYPNANYAGQFNLVKKGRIKLSMT